MTHPIPDEALDSDIAILGRKGGGKTYTSKGIVERLLDMGRRVLVLDPLGVWAGLRTSADGTKAGYPVAIFGGLHADMPLDPAAAEPLAEIIANENLPAVIDLSELSKGKQQAFLYAFLHRLRTVNREALTIVLEEADVFAPQNPQGDDSKQLHGEIDWIARRGRFRGFRLISITQRPARLSKDVLTQCATLIAHKLPSPQDRDAVKAWVDGNGDRDKAKEVFDTLAGLDVGEAWVWAPEQDILGRFRFPTIKTLDTSSTPKAGEQRIEPKTLAEVDISAIRKALQEVQVEKKPAGGAGKPSASDIAAAEERGYERGYAQGKADEWARGASAIRAEVVVVAQDAKALAQRLAALGGAIEQISKDVAAPLPSKAAAPVRRAVEVDLATDPLLRAALQVWPAKMTWAGLCSMNGLKARGGSFNTRKRRLIDGGLVREEGGLVIPTNPPATPEGVIPADLLEQNLPTTAAEAFRMIRKNPGITLDELARRLGVVARGGSWNNRLFILRSNGLVDESGGRLSIPEELL